jgi:hypothetical protein
MTTTKTGVTGTDANAAVRFLGELFRRSQSPVFIISMGKVPTDNRTIVTREKDAVREFIRKWDQPGRALFYCLTTVTPFTRLDALTCLHADLDFRGIDASREWIERAIEALPLRPQLVVFSGHGFHLYWLLREALAFTPENIARIELALLKLAEVLAGDPMVCECAQLRRLSRRDGGWIPGLMRLPGSHNTKNGDSIRVRVIKQRKGWHRLERIEAWLRIAKPVLQPNEDNVEAVRHWIWRRILVKAERRWAPGGAFKSSLIDCVEVEERGA